MHLKLPEFNLTLTSAGIRQVVFVRLLPPGTTTPPRTGFAIEIGIADERFTSVNDWPSEENAEQAIQRIVEQIGLSPAIRAG